MFISLFCFASGRFLRFTKFLRCAESRSENSSQTNEISKRTSDTGKGCPVKAAAPKMAGLDPVTDSEADVPDRKDLCSTAENKPPCDPTKAASKHKIFPDDRAEVLVEDPGEADLLDTNLDSNNTDQNKFPSERIDPVESGGTYARFVVCLFFAQTILYFCTNMNREST